MAKHQKNSLVSILAGYRNLLLIIARILLLFIAAAAINVILIYPLWYAALRHTEFYTAATGVIFSVLLVIAAVKKIKKVISAERQTGGSPANRLFRPIIRAAKIAVFLGCLYLTALTFHLKYYPAAAAGALTTFLAGGYMFFGKKDS